MMNTMTTQTTVAIAVPLEAELVERIRAVDPSVTVLYEPELLPPERFPADHSGDPDFRRTPEQEERYWDMLNKAQVLYGFPNESPAGLARIAGSNPRLEWIHAMAAGAGGAVKASGLDAGALQKFKVTTSAGVHALPLAEFAAFGILNGFKRTAELAQDQAARNWPELRTPTRLVNGSHLVVTGLGEIGLETCTDRPRSRHERSAAPSGRSSPSTASRTSRTTAASPDCWPRPTPSSTPFRVRRPPRSSSAATCSQP